MRPAVLILSLTAFGCGTKVPPPFPYALENAAGRTDLVFQHHVTESGGKYITEMMGSGVALLDFDNDGDLDVLLVQGTGSHVLFRNEIIPSGKLTFTRVREFASSNSYGMGVATGDFNNDGSIDVLITSYGNNILLRNAGSGTFVDVTAESPDVRGAGLWSTSASFFDYDRDGWQDLIILTYVDWSIANNKKCTAPTGEMDYCTPNAYRPLPARLFHNEKGRFVDVTRKAGIDRALGPGLGVVAFDANDDGWLDLFVANDAMANHLWINQHNGTFKESALEMGVAYGENGLAKAGMGVAAGDYDNDGDEDILVLNLNREGATLFRNERQTGFTDVSTSTGIHSLSFPFTGFGTGWLDFDNNGLLDVFMANGAVTIRHELRAASNPYLERNLLLGQLAAGKFVDLAGSAGPSLHVQGVARGAAFGDIDNDGDIDIVLIDRNEPVRLLLNNSPRHNWLRLEVKGPGLGLGAVIRLERDDGTALIRRIRTDSSYLSASAPAAHFGLGETQTVRRLVITWPNGATQMIHKPKLGHITITTP